MSTRVLLDLLGWRGQILASSRLTARPGRSVRLVDLAAVRRPHVSVRDRRHDLS
ncbi:hypothetical protein [Streptomyces agglomeratus]|uniref:hypothetical protein n=1 Tax=Streptomyces agglomeratus TaxID=285458 RepID=UPI001FD062E7|nr:hypothetical protein [Streptomyces agglomeratus]